MARTASLVGRSRRARLLTAVVAGGLGLGLAISPCASSSREDDKLERRARTRLDESQELRRRSIDVAVENAVAVLTGRVETLAERRAAMQIVGRVAGLTDVRSRLTVATAGRQDSRIESQVVRAFRERLVLIDTDIGISVERGVCTLTGRVRDGRAKGTARRAAEEVEGVVGVLDRLTTREVSDEVLQKRAERLFASRGRVVIEGRFRVAVRDGVLLLTGKVPRPYERMIAGELPLGITGLRGFAARIDVVPPPSEVPVVRPH